MKRLAFITLLLGLIAALGIGYVVLQSSRPTPHLLSGAIDPKTGAYKYSEKTDYVHIEADMPNRTSLWKWWNPNSDTAARTVIETWLKGDIESFKSNVRVDDMPPELLTSVRDRGGYAYTAQYERFLSTTSTLLSYKYDTYVDTGGAHPNTYFKTFVFDRAGRELKLADLFVPNTDYLARIAATSLTQVDDDLKTRLGTSTTGAIFMDGLDPKEENFSNFVIDGDSLVVFFPPYQVAAYAAGDFTVHIPLKDLSDILRPEWW